MWCKIVLMKIYTNMWRLRGDPTHKTTTERYETAGEAWEAFVDADKRIYEMVAFPDPNLRDSEAKPQ